MTDEIKFYAPDGSQIDGAAQIDQSCWCVRFGDAADPTFEMSYLSDGPTADWAEYEIDGEQVWVDENGTEWLTRHLVDQRTAALFHNNALSPEAIASARVDIERHVEMDLVLRAQKSMPEGYNPLFIAVSAMTDAAVSAKAQAAVLRDRDITLARASAAVGDRLLTDKEIVALANEMAVQVMFDCYGIVVHGKKLVVDHVDPRGKQAWRAVAIAFERLRGTEIDEALENVRGEG